MGRIAALLVLALSFGSAIADEFKVVNVRPSRLLAVLAGLEPKPGIKLYEITGVEGQVIPIGLHVKADDEKSLLIAEGNAKDCEAFGQIVKLVDVKPRDIQANFELNVPLEKYQSVVQAKIRNNAAWEVSDQSADLSFSVKPRINDDGTITVFFTVGDGKEGRTMIIRMKNGETVTLPLDGLTGIRVRDVEPQGKEDPNMPSIKLTFKALDS